MSTGWGRGPGGDIGPRGTSKVVPGEAIFRNETGASAPPRTTPTPGRPYLTRGAIDVSCLPSRFTMLKRSPEHKVHLPQVWTTGLNGKPTYEVYASIVSDVALNKPPDLILQSPTQITESSTSTILSPQSLKVSSLERSSIPFQPDRKGSHIPEQAQSSFLSRIFSRLRSGFLCRRPTTSSSPGEPKKEERTYSETEQQNERKPAPKGPHFQEPSLSVGSTSKSFNIKSRSKSFRESHLKPPPPFPNEEDERLKASRSLLDLQRERERADLSQSTFLQDIKVFHNIRRREIVAKALYRESGQLFARLGPPGDPNPPIPPVMLFTEPSPLPPIKRNFEKHPSMTRENRRKILSKIIQLRPHLESVSTGEERDPIWENCNFAQDCLRAHNLYRARHSAPPLILSKKLCNLAQSWANHLAQTGILRYKGDRRYGENIFCRNIALAIKTRLTVPDITGEEIAAYWYSNVRHYRFNLPDTALHAHAGSYSQMVWKDSKKFGVGKALSRSGKLIVVAHYHPPGNISNHFRCNVLPLSTRALAAEMLCQGQALLEEALAEPEEGIMSLQKALLNVGVGVSGVLGAQPPNIKGINATKILAAHMLGHAATVVTTPDEKLEVVIVSRKSMKNKRSRMKKQQEEPTARSTCSSPLDLLTDKAKKDDLNFQHVEKALKEVLNMKLKEKESKSAPNILTSSGHERPPRLSETKKVKFKSEENINLRDRSKAVQTSFSSENLSTEDGNIDSSVSRVSSPFLESEDETLSWTETSSSAFSSNIIKDKTTNSTETVSTTFDSQTKESNNTYSKSYAYLRRTLNEDPENTLRMASNSSELNVFSCSSCRSTDVNIPTSSSNSETNKQYVHMPKMCNIRRIPFSEGSYKGSLDSIKSISPEASIAEAKSSNSDVRGSEDEKSSRLNLPFDSPNAESGLMNCYALSPLHY